MKSLKPQKDSLSYCLLAIVATTLWGSAFAVGKIGFEYMPPIMLSGVRFMLAGLLLLPMILITKVDWRTQMRGRWRFMLLFGFVQTFIQYGLFYMGLNLVPGAISAVIIGSGPLFVAVLAHFIMPNDKFSTRKVLAIALGIAGVISISLTGESLSLSSPHFYRGVALLIASNILGSYTNIMVAKYGAGISSSLLTMVANFSGGVLLFATSLIVEPHTALHTALPMEFYVALLWLAFIPAAGFSIWYYLLSLPDVKVSELNIWKFLVPIVGVVLSWVMLSDESPTLGTIVGIVIITTSVIVLQWPTIRQAIAPRKR